MQQSKITPLYVAVLILLGGCGPREDMADNPPKLGQWQIEAKLVSATFDNVSLEEEEAKALGLNSINRPVKSLGCTEPDLEKAEDLTSMLPGKLGDNCSVKEFDGDRAQFSAMLTCRPPKPIKDASVRMDGIAGQNEVTIRNAVSIGLEEEGAIHRADIAQRIIMTRLGDCS